jgi:hypothetical protein
MIPPLAVLLIPVLSFSGFLVVESFWVLYGLELLQEENRMLNTSIKEKKILAIFIVKGFLIKKIKLFN